MKLYALRREWFWLNYFGKLPPWTSKWKGNHSFAHTTLPWPAGGSLTSHYQEDDLYNVRYLSSFKEWFWLNQFRKLPFWTPKGYSQTILLLLLSCTQLAWPPEGSYSDQSLPGCSTFDTYKEVILTIYYFGKHSKLRKFRKAALLRYIFFLQKTSYAVKKWVSSSFLRNYWLNTPGKISILCDRMKPEV